MGPEAVVHVASEAVDLAAQRREDLLRERNRTLDYALLLAIDKIRERDDEGLTELEWQERLIGGAARRMHAEGVA